MELGGATMNARYLLLGGEGALADRALKKISAELADEKAEVTTLLAADVIPGDIADALDRKSVV